MFGFLKRAQNFVGRLWNSSRIDAAPQAFVSEEKQTLLGDDNKVSGLNDAFDDNESVISEADTIIDIEENDGLSGLKRHSLSGLAFMAAEGGNVDFLARLLKKDPELVHCMVEGTYETLLHCAAENSNNNVCRLLITAGANPDAYNRVGAKPIDMVDMNPMSSNSISFDRRESLFAYLEPLTDMKNLISTKEGKAYNDALHKMNQNRIIAPDLLVKENRNLEEYLEQSDKVDNNPFLVASDLAHGLVNTVSRESINNMASSVFSGIVSGIASGVSNISSLLKPFYSTTNEQVIATDVNKIDIRPQTQEPAANPNPLTHEALAQKAVEQARDSAAKSKVAAQKAREATRKGQAGNMMGG